MEKAPYLITQISKIIQAKVLGRAAPQAYPISYLQTDSRQIKIPEQSIFFALKGPHHDGHRFLDQAFEKGIRYFVVAQAPKNWPHQEGLFLLVPDTLLALQELCSFHRSQFQLPVIGITGSNGKTTVKEWLFHLLQDDYYTIRSPRSYNSQIGVPLSVWPLRAEHELAIFEAGISQVGEMEALTSIIQPTIGLLTNIGSAHDAGFESRTQKLNEKLKLFQSSDLIIYQTDHGEIEQAISTLNKTTFSWSFDHPADLHIKATYRQNSGTSIVASYKGQKLETWIPFLDAAAIENAIHCWATGLYLGLKNQTLAARMSQLAPIAMRMELQEGINDCTLINDSYNSDLQSLSIALDFAQQQRANTTLTLILSDILQSGSPADQLYQEVAKLIYEHQVNRIIGVGTMIPLVEQYVAKGVSCHFFPDTTALLQKLDQLFFEQETILIKGARPFTFEAVAQQLTPHTHRTILEVNLSALAHNLRTFHSRLEQDTRMMVMVKAAAYGGGSQEIARLLHFQGIRYLGVAYVDEGIELRQAGISLPIMVLNPDYVSFPALLAYQLEPEIYSLAQLKALSSFTMAKNAPLQIHLKVDTGMHRLGFTASDILDITTLLGKNPLLQVASIFSHLAASEIPSEDAFTHQQAKDFFTFYNQITTHLSYRPLRHLLNSAGIARFPQYQMEMVRLGIGMYGIEICTELQGLLRPVFRLRSRISQIRDVASGETIGYGRRGRAEEDRRIATVSIGYADGLLRKAGNGRYAFSLHGQLASTVGNICMDMCMIDVSHIPEAQEGDEVLIFGEELGIEKLTKVYESIPYEVLTGISGRVKRMYVSE